MLSASIRFDLDTVLQADVIEAALRPELGDEVPGSRASMRREGLALVIEIEAEDPGALRAALNSYLRWTQTAIDVQRVATA